MYITKNIKGKLIIVVLSLVFVVAFAACGNEPTERGTIVMGTSADFPPFEFIAPDGQGIHGEFDGIDVAIAVRIAEALDMDLYIHDSQFAGLIMDLQARRIDFIAAGMTINDERRESVNFSIPYFSAMQHIVVPNTDTTTHTVADLAGQIVGVQVGTTGDIFATYNLQDSTIQAYMRATEAFMDLVGGRIDAVLIDSAVADLFVSQHVGQLRVVRDHNAFSNEEYGIAVHLEDLELLEQINDVLSDMIANGEIAELFMHYSAMLQN